MIANFVYFAKLSALRYQYLVCTIDMADILSINLQGPKEDVFTDLKRFAIKSRRVQQTVFTEALSPNNPPEQSLFKYAEFFNNIGLKSLDYGYVQGMTRAPVKVRTEDTKFLSVYTDQFSKCYPLSVVVNTKDLPNLTQMNKALKHLENHARALSSDEDSFQHRLEQGQDLAVIDNKSAGVKYYTETDNVIIISRQPYFL